jgi:hypothetical protein
MTVRPSYSAWLGPPILICAATPAQRAAFLRPSGAPSYYMDGCMRVVWGLCERIRWEWSTCVAVPAQRAALLRLSALLSYYMDGCMRVVWELCERIRRERSTCVAMPMQGRVACCPGSSGAGSRSSCARRAAVSTCAASLYLRLIKCVFGGVSIRAHLKPHHA